MMTTYELMRWVTFPVMPVLLNRARKDILNLVNSHKTHKQAYSILDVGGRKSPYTIHIGANITLLDVPQESATQAQLNLGFTSELLSFIKKKRSNIREVVVQDMTKTTLESETYDLVICWHVLEHIPDDVKAIQEVFRLLKPNGKFLVSVPIFPIGNLKTYEDAKIEYKDYENIHGHYDHCRSCGLDYFKRFEAQGFKTNTLNVNSLAETNTHYFGLNHDHVVWCFTK